MGSQRSPGLLPLPFQMSWSLPSPEACSRSPEEWGTVQESPPKQSLQGLGCGSETPSQMRGGVNPERSLLPRGVGMEGKKNQVCFFPSKVDIFISLFLFLKQFFVSEYQ